MNPTMPIGRDRAARLTRCGVVVSSGRWPVGALASAALLVSTLATGTYAAHLHGQQRAAQQVDDQQLRGLQLEVERAQQLHRLSAARGQELEHQIDVLNRALRESQQELSVLRSARGGKP